MVVPIDKLSILVTITFSYIVFHEGLTRKATAGLVLLVAGTLIMLIQRNRKKENNWIFIKMPHNHQEIDDDINDYEKGLAIHDWIVGGYDVLKELMN